MSTAANDRDDEKNSIESTPSRFAQNPDTGTVHDLLEFAPGVFTVHSRCGRYQTEPGAGGFDADSPAEAADRFGEDALCGTCFADWEGDA